ncbi:MAG: flagellar basal body-associated FliL family protein [Bacillota bacterium]
MIKKMVILAVIAAILGGGCYFGWVYYQKARSAPPKPVVIKVGDFVTNLSSDSRRMIKVSLEVRGESAQVAKQISKENAQVRYLVLSVLRSKTLEEVSVPGGMERLAEEVRAELNAFLGSGKISAVYFTEFVLP